MSTFAQPTRPTIDFNFIYQSHEAMVRAVVRRFRFQDATADDLVQNIFIKAWSGLEKLDNHACLAGWLRVIARNQCLNEIKSQKLLSKYFTPVESFTKIADEATCNDSSAASALQLEHHLSTLRELIQHHKDPIRREIACLFYLESRSIQEICQDLNMNQNTVLSHLRRFRLIVRKAMHRFMEEQAR